ncbi:PWWP domain-containing protein [Mycena chlorophos]|uniref:PWWP domain-containing protein n=1 Tax=Mycena chlorophos TaxID=658473 RepID=A0A8H6SVV7_MYCCL|nr:PWWP domain-containing protein [Mycena chlorophos]
MSAKRSASTAKKNEPEETYETGDIVLGKLRGYPPWPSRVVDPDNVPKSVTRERPGNRKTTAYVVRFFPAGDYSWLSASELTRLTTDECEKYIADNEVSEGSKGKKELLEGYRACLDPDAWEKEHDSAPPAKKGGRKKKVVEEDDDDEDEDAAAEDDDDESTGKKRKRTSSSKAKPSSSKKKGGKKGKKSKETVESEDEGADDGDAEPKERPSKKSKSEKEPVNPKLENDPEALKVREWRHKLQKVFLPSNKQMPKEEDMPSVDELFTVVEQYQHMSIEYLTFSKIGKVMRHIHLLEADKVPRDAEFRFRERAKALVDRWHMILNANKADDAKGEGAEKEVNGAAAGADADGDADGDLTMMDESQA